MIKIIKLLKTIDFLASFSENALRMLLKHCNITAYPPDSQIIQEGDIGDACYIILSGTVHVYTQDRAQRPILLARLTRGEYFGEQALLNTQKNRRNASVVTKTNCTRLLRIPRHIFLNLIKENEQLQQTFEQRLAQQRLSKIVQQEPLFHSLSQDKAFDFAGTLHHIHSGTILFSENTEPDYVYYLISGTVQISFADNKPSTQVSAHQLLGEYSVIHQTKRQGSAKATTDIDVLRFDADLFLRSYQQSHSLKKLIDSLTHVYQLTKQSSVTQFSGYYLHQPATCSLFDFGDKKFMAWRLLTVDLFILRELDVKTYQVVSYCESNEFYTRELNLIGDRLIGLVAESNWSDLHIFCDLILKRQTLTAEQLEEFISSGTIQCYLPSKGIYHDNQLICECMQVKYSTLKRCINQGYDSVQALSRKTGACTVCCSCQPVIKHILGHESWTSAYITYYKQLADSIYLLRIKPVRGFFESFIPGQHIVLQAPVYSSWISRAYTLTSDANHTEFYEIIIRIETEGHFSNWFMNNLKKTKFIRISKPQGEFIINTKKSTPIIFFAGGIGITPAIAFAQQYLSQTIDRILLIDYSARGESQFIYNKQLRKIAAQNAKLQLNLRDTNKQGRFTENDIQRLLSHYPQADIYCCGPLQFNEALCKTLKKLGVTNERIFIESFKFKDTVAENIDTFQ
ncbi:MAG: hypothetical protein Tsb005_19500 [Gammaproteobacteria bacterium]